MDETTYDVRVWKIETYKGAKVTTHKVRWKVADKSWKRPFRNKAQADSFRSAILTAAKKGEPFSIATGRPISWEREEDTITWYTHTLAYTDAKWPYASPNHRRGIAEALTDATEALLTTEQGKPSREEIRGALREWAYSGRLQKGGDPPERFVPVLRWLERHTSAMSDFSHDKKGPALTRAVLDRLSRKKAGELAAGNTANRKRMVFNNTLEHACETGILQINPLTRVKWTKPRTAQTLDTRIVVNAGQARQLLAAVEIQGERGRRMVAFFAVMYYAALRPEEAVDLHLEHLITLPEQGWGEMRLTHSEPRSGSRWTNSGKPRDRQPLKHRADGETRSVPIHPDLAKLLRHHIDENGVGPDGRLFVGPRGGIMTDRTYLAVWHRARKAALTAREAASPLAETPYALRHAAVSTWLSAGVPPQQVAAWAGHSVNVLLRFYAACVAGQAGEAKRRIIEATKSPDPPADDAA
jgi:integrase